MAQGTVLESSLPARQIEMVEDDILAGDDPLIEEEYEDEPLPPEPGEIQEPSPAERAEQERLDVLRARAIRAGWVPREQFRGDPREWRDFEEFVKRGEEITPMLQRQLRGAEARADNLQKDVNRLTSTVEQLTSTVEQLRQMNATAEQEGFDRAIASLKAQRREAAVANDMVTFNDLNDQIDQLEQQREARRTAAPPPAPKPAEAPQPAPQVLQPEVTAFIASNPWYESDMVLRAAMIQEHVKLLEQAPGMTLADNLEVAKARVMKDFPDKFGMPAVDPQRRPKRPAPQVPGNNGGGPRREATGIAAIQDPVERAQARAGFEAARRTMPDVTEAEYLEIYNDPKGDVLDLQRRVAERRRQPQQPRRRAQ